MAITSQAKSPGEEAEGTIVGVRAGFVIVQLNSGEHVSCSVKRLHRPFGFFMVPFGRQARIRYTRGPDRPPLIVEIVKD
jgi:hypothetical protein